MEKIAWDGPKRGRDVLFPANPDLADISGDTDFDFENFIFGICLDPRFPDSWISRFLDLGSRFLAMAGCGSRGTPVDGTPGPQNSGDPRN